MKSRHYIGIISCIIVFIFSSYSCKQRTRSVETKHLSHPNSTCFHFNFSETKLRDTIVKLFGIEPQIDDPILKSVFMDRILKGSSFQVNFTPETSDKPVFGSDYFKLKGTDSDIFLYPMGSAWYSPMYFHKDEPFLFSSSFALKFKPISEKETLLIIEDVNPEISNGTKCCGPEGNYAVMQKVSPTTVEEYTLILYIAHKLGIHNMPPVHLPQ